MIMNKSVLRRALVGVIMLTVSLLASAQGGSISVKATKIWDGKEYVWTSSFSYSFKGLIDVKQVGERIDTLNATSFEQGYDGTSYLVVREYSAKIHDGERAAFTLGWTGFSGPPASAVRQMYSDIPIYLGVRPWDLASAKAKACKLGEGYPSITDSIKGSYSMNPDNNTHDHTLETQSNTGYIGSGGTVYLDGVGGYKRGQPNVLISHCKVILHLTHLPKREGAMDDDTDVVLDENDDEKNELYVIDPKPENIRWKWTVKDIADQGGVQKVLSDIIGNETTQMGLDVALVGAGLGSIGTLVSHAHSRTFKDYNVAQQRLLELQKQLNDIDLMFHPRWQSAGEGHVYYMLCCTGGVLNAPNRFDAELEVTAVHKGKVHTFKRTVHILSQPKREFKTYAEQKAALAHDDEIIEGLWSIESGIQAAGLNARMAPLLYFVRLQIDFYHQDYGFDARNIEAIKNVYLHVLQREADEAGVKAVEATACDNLKWYQLDWWIQRSLEGHEYLEKMPLAMRIGFAVASLGFTEIVYEVPYQMKKYIDEGGESTLGAFKVGAVVAVKAYAIEAAVGLGLGAAGAVGKGVLRGVKGTAKGTAQAVKVAAKESVKAGGRVAKEAMKDALKAAKETMKSEASTGLKTFLKKQVILHEKGVLEKALEHETKALLESVKKVAGGSKYATAEAFAKRQAVENIENLQTMIELCHWHPTIENVRLRNQLIMRCQADKQTMLLLKTPRLLGDDPLLQGLSLKVLKKDFNGLLRKIYTETDELVKADLAIAGKMPIDKIKILGATSSSADLAKGLNITFDRDVTYYYVLNGKPHYFSQTYVEKLYAKHFRNVVNSRTLTPSTTGFNPGQLTPQALKSLEEMEAKQAAIAARLYDQTVVEDVARHFESYGEDLNRMVNPELHGEALKNPTKVAEAVLHKGTSRFDYADELWRQAELADSVVQKEILEAQAVSEMMEGCRQIKKVFDIIKARDAVRNTYSKIPDEVNRAVDILRNLNGVETKLSQAEAALAQKGFTFRSLSQAVSDAVIQVG